MEDAFFVLFILLFFENTEQKIPTIDCTLNGHRCFLGMGRAAESIPSREVEVGELQKSMFKKKPYIIYNDAKDNEEIPKGSMNFYI